MLPCDFLLLKRLLYFIFSQKMLKLGPKEMIFGNFSDRSQTKLRSSAHLSLYFFAEIQNNDQDMTKKHILDDPKLILRQIKIINPILKDCKVL